MSENIPKTCYVRGHPRKNGNYAKGHVRKGREPRDGMDRVDSTNKREAIFTIENGHNWNELKHCFLGQLFSSKELNNISTKVAVTIDFELLNTKSFENRGKFFNLCKQTFKVQDCTRIKVEWKRYTARDFKSKKKSRNVSTSLSQSQSVTQHRTEGPAYPPNAGPITSRLEGQGGELANCPPQHPFTSGPSTYSGGGQGSQFSQITTDYSHAYPPSINPTTSIPDGHESQIYRPIVNYPTCPSTSPTNRSFCRRENETYPNAMMSDCQLPTVHQPNASFSQSDIRTQHRFEGPAYPPNAGPITSHLEGQGGQFLYPIVTVLFCSL